MLNVIRIGSRVRSPAGAARVQLEDAGPAVATSLTGLAIEPSAKIVVEFRLESRAVGIHAYPEPRKATVQGVDAAWQQPGFARVAARHAA